MAAKFAVGVFGFALTLIISICVMMFGWGLEPRSWWWIIGGGVGLKMIVTIIEQIGKNG